MTVIADYGVGNLFSLYSSLKAVGEEAEITGDVDKIEKADRIILPGVGAFEDAAKKLRDSGVAETIKAAAKKGTPILGICLGMQHLFEKSYEFGEHEGLGLIPGDVVPLKGVIDENLKIPHIGWNSLEIKNDSPIFKYIEDGDFVYFVHSYYAETGVENVIAFTEYDKRITAAAGNGNVFGCQFHPEKSGETGLKILKAFCEL